MPVSRLLRAGVKLEETSKYALPCDGLDAFISHAWMSPWWLKRLTLLLQFYCKSALVVSCFSAAVLFVFDVAGFLPTVHVPTSVNFPGKINISSNFAVDVSPWSSAPIVLSLIMLFLGPELCGGQRDKSVFFDMACISQDDEELRSEGIASLAGFLDKSKELVVLWSPDNLTRTWCVFELAVYSALADNGRRKITWCPLHFYGIMVVIYLASGLAFFLFMVSLIVQVPNGKYAALSAILAALSFITAMAFHWGRMFMREKHGLLTDVAKFEVEHTKCAVASDKEFIKQSIEHWYGNESNFNDYVRGPMAATIDRALGGIEGSYRLCLMATTANLWLEFSFVAAYMRAGAPWDAIASQVLWALSKGFCMLPVWLKLALIVMDMRRHKQTTKAADMALSLLLAIVWSMTLYCTSLLGTVARDSGLVMSLAWFAFFTFLSYIVFAVFSPSHNA